MDDKSKESVVENSSSMLVKLAKSPFRFKLYLLKNLPMAYLSGLGIEYFDNEQAAISVSLSYLTKNPFRSIYFACLAMAAELSTGVLAMNAIEQSGQKFSFLVVGLEAEFKKKAKGVITFTSTNGLKMQETIQQCIQSGESEKLTAKSVGKNEEGKTVAEFSITWSFKPKT